MTPEQERKAVQAMSLAAAMNVESFARRMLWTFENQASACQGDRQMTIDLHRPSKATLERFDELREINALLRK